MKLSVFSLICLFPLMVSAEPSFVATIPAEDMSVIRQVLDMKVFHDAFFVENMISGIYEQENSGEYSNPSVMREIGHENLFNDRDSELLRHEIAGRVLRTKLIQTPWDDQVAAIHEDPFEAFIGLIENQQVLKLEEKEIEDLNSVDKGVITQTIQMLTESGPDVGAAPVAGISAESLPTK